MNRVNDEERKEHEKPKEKKKRKPTAQGPVTASPVDSPRFLEELRAQMKPAIKKGKRVWGTGGGRVGHRGVVLAKSE